MPRTFFGPRMRVPGVVSVLEFALAEGSIFRSGRACVAAA